MTYDLAAIKHDLVGKKPGLALDIDDTLSYTWAYWAQELMRIGGNPENLTWQEVGALVGDKEGEDELWYRE